MKSKEEIKQEMFKQCEVYCKENWWSLLKQSLLQGDKSTWAIEIPSFAKILICDTGYNHFAQVYLNEPKAKLYFELTAGEYLGMRELITGSKQEEYSALL